jgi:PAS domain S-box-containing protein
MLRSAVSAAVGRKLSGIEYLPLLVALAIACAIAVFSIRDWAVYKQWRSEVLRHDAVVAHTNALLSDVKDAETGQRGFLLTGKDSYLEPYRESSSRIRTEFSALQGVVNSSEGGRLRALNKLVEEKLGELQHTIDLRTERGFAAAVDVVQTDRGKLLMDQIRSDIQGIMNQETGAALTARNHVRSSAASLEWVSVLGSLTLVALLLAAQVALRNTNAKRLRLITELRKGREEISAARDLLQTTLQSIGDAVIATDAEGRVTFLNPVAQHLSGWTQQSAVGAPLPRVFRIINETTRVPVDNPVDRVMQTGRIVGLANHTILLTPDGREIPIDDSAAPIHNAKGDIVGTVLVFRDVTERRRAELELRKGQSQLERSNAALQQLNSDLELFAYAAGHDLQEPL